MLAFGKILITKVTFTEYEAAPSIQKWFGSSGGGLPRRSELIVQDAFLFGIQGASLATPSKAPTAYFFRVG
jgi:hypothetical protein